MEALGGLTVLDLARGFPPAHSTMFLADFGARVIKVDPPSPPTVDAESEKSAAFKRTNRNKETMIINLMTKEGQGVLYRLAGKADVLVEGFRPGVMKKMNVDYETLRKINPRLIYCAETGFGSDGPYEQIPGHDPCFLSIAGALSMIGPKGGAPCPPSNYLADIAGGGLHGLIGILIALIAREKTGKGQYIDISYTDGVLSLMDQDTGPYLQKGTVNRRGETFATGATIWGHEYKCKDGEYFTVCCREPIFWKNFCMAIGREDLIALHDAPQKEQDRGIEELNRLFATKTRNEWWNLLKDKDTCVAPVNNIDDALNDPQLLHRRMVIELKHAKWGEIKQIGFPVKLSDTPAKVKSLGKPVGSDTNNLLKEFGYTQAEIKGLKQKSVVN